MNFKGSICGYFGEIANLRLPQSLLIVPITIIIVVNLIITCLHLASRRALRSSAHGKLFVLRTHSALK